MSKNIYSKRNSPYVDPFSFLEDDDDDNDVDRGSNDEISLADAMKRINAGRPPSVEIIDDSDALNSIDRAACRPARTCSSQTGARQPRSVRTSRAARKQSGQTDRAVRSILIEEDGRAAKRRRKAARILERARSDDDGDGDDDTNDPVIEPIRFNVVLPAINIKVESPPDLTAPSPLADDGDITILDLSSSPPKLARHGSDCNSAGGCSREPSDSGVEMTPDFDAHRATVKTEEGNFCLKILLF